MELDEEMDEEDSSSIKRVVCYQVPCSCPFNIFTVKLNELCTWLMTSWRLNRMRLSLFF